jgi:hypothetical protein
MTLGWVENDPPRPWEEIKCDSLGNTKLADQIAEENAWKFWRTVREILAYSRGGQWVAFKLPTGPKYAEVSIILFYFVC